MGGGTVRVDEVGCVGADLIFVKEVDWPGKEEGVGERGWRVASQGGKDMRTLLGMAGVGREREVGSHCPGQGESWRVPPRCRDSATKKVAALEDKGQGHQGNEDYLEW